MRQSLQMWIGLALMALATSGCGGEPAEDSADTAPAQQAPDRPGEVVVEPSEPRFEVDGAERDTRAVVLELLDAETTPMPVGYTLAIDRDFAQPGRVRFWVEPMGEADEEADKAAAASVYDALAESFRRRMSAALQAQLDSAEAQARDAVEQTTGLQAQLRAFQESRRGLGSTDTSRLERRRIERALDQALERQIEINEAVQDLQRRLDRGRVAELYRIR